MKIGIAETWDEASRAALTLALSQKEREQEFWLPFPWGEELGMRVIHPAIQQRLKINYQLIGFRLRSTRNG